MSDDPAAMIAAVLRDLHTQFSDAGEGGGLARSFIYKAQVHFEQTEARLTRLIGADHGVTSKISTPGGRS